MEESGIENSETVTDYAKRRRLKGTVGSKHSKLSKKQKAALAVGAGIAAAAGAAIGVHRKSEYGGAKVTFLPGAHAQEKEPTDTQAQEQKEVKNNQRLFDEVFHNLNDAQRTKARQTVDMFKTRISEKNDYITAHKKIPLKYQDQIAQTAKAYGISEDALRGIISVENGGGEDITNKNSGARGVAQFLPETARQYGLIVNKNMDERTDPAKSIAAAGKYLEQHKTLFGGDEGLAIWSYHAGAGNVFRALRAYFINVHNIDIGDYGWAIANNKPEIRASVELKARELITQDSLDVSKLLSNKAVQEQVAWHLDDYSDTYTFQIVAANELLNEETNEGIDLGSGLRVSIGNNPTSNPIVNKPE